MKYILLFDLAMIYLAFAIWAIGGTLIVIRIASSWAIKHFCQACDNKGPRHNAACEFFSSDIRRNNDDEF